MYVLNSAFQQKQRNSYSIWQEYQSTKGKDFGPCIAALLRHFYTYHHPTNLDNTFSHFQTMQYPCMSDNPNSSIRRNSLPWYWTSKSSHSVSYTRARCHHGHSQYWFPPSRDTIELLRQGQKRFKFDYNRATSLLTINLPCTCLIEYIHTTFIIPCKMLSTTLF